MSNNFFQMGLFKKKNKDNEIMKEDRFESDDKKDLLLVYAVSESQKEYDDSTQLPILTITSDLSDAYEYISLKLFDEYHEHYESWCNLKELDFKDTENWIDYCSSVIDDENESHYVIRRLYYKVKDIASVLRMFNHCEPIGASYEDEFEKPSSEEIIDNETSSSD